jgi:hypothetical protein
MDILKVEELTDQHLKEYWSIFAIDDKEDFAREIWNSRRLLPFVSAQHEGTMVKQLYVRVPSLDDAGIEHAIRHLREIDFVSRDRTVGFPSPEIGS